MGTYQFVVMKDNFRHPIVVSRYTQKEIRDKRGKQRRGTRKSKSDGEEEKICV